MTSFETLCINAVFEPLCKFDWFLQEKARDDLTERIRKGLTAEEETIYRNVRMRHIALSRSLTSLASDKRTEFHWWDEKEQRFTVKGVSQ